MAVDISRKLTHRGQWATTTNTTDDYGGFTEITSIQTLNCFAYLETRTRFLSNPAIALGREWKVILPQQQQLIEVNDYFNQIFDEDGSRIHPGGRVASVIVYRHYEDGPQFIELTLADN